MTHLTKRTGVYYYRRKIPLELRHLYAGKAEIIFSLQTKERSEAEPLARKYGVFHDEEFATARINALGAPNEAAPSPTPNSSPSVKPKIVDGLGIERRVIQQDLQAVSASLLQAADRPHIEQIRQAARRVRVVPRLLVGQQQP